MLFGKELTLVHTRSQKLSVIYTTVLVSINRLHHRSQFLQRRHILLILQSNLQLLNRNLTIMIQINLTEQIAQILHLLLRQLSSNESSSQLFYLHATISTLENLEKFTIREKLTFKGTCDVCFNTQESRKIYSALIRLLSGNKILLIKCLAPVLTESISGTKWLRNYC